MSSWFMIKNLSNMRQEQKIRISLWEFLMGCRSSWIPWFLCWVATSVVDEFEHTDILCWNNSLINIQIHSSCLPPRVTSLRTVDTRRYELAHCMSLPYQNCLQNVRLSVYSFDEDYILHRDMLGILRCNAVTGVTPLYRSPERGGRVWMKPWNGSESKVA